MMKTVSREEQAMFYESVNARYFELLIFKMVLNSALWKQNMLRYKWR